MIHFEHPLSERVRNFLRIAYLFRHFHEVVVRKEVWAHHCALFSLFEIMEAAARAELKLDILQELERQKGLARQRGEDGKDALETIQTAISNLQNVQQKFGQHLRENEWLMAIKQRIFVPGGTSPYDLPSYYYWQQKNPEERESQLRQWIQSLLPTYEAISLLLEILRHNSLSVECVANAGSYQHNSLGQNIHLLGINVAQHETALPEVSANKYFTHIRFLQASQQQARGLVLTTDIPFTLVMCSFDAVIK
ncbi:MULTISPECIES: cell division protein ZapD [Snodgrassella]|uniref:Cell division protein ZapD n=1 Tax=Snodgrassella alvi TaxID=1196083 RepID=A0A2N9XA32_9NEIS|nr:MULTISPECIES: cell division protein ZapD [Snodgrassella]MCX8749749.1 cell division protein ZapD [Snodgrassella sp. B3088]PIT40401.1 cell division protein ZapD [Snodgrassella alvi]PIT41324.1 cell division protein ZapD [Snodgrassella alvi]PIT42353.1 cell division protein ZapD [Snodgrassella alvi]